MFTLSSPHLFSQQILNETFQDGSVTSGPSSTDLTYYSSGGVSIGTDSTLDPTTNHDVLQNNNPGSPVIANFGQTLSLSTGNTVVVTLNFRFLTNSTGESFRFGLFNSNSTPVTANGFSNVTTAAGDDPGLWYNYTMTALTTNGGTINFAAETGTNGTAFGGSDRTFLSFAGGSAASAFTPDTNVHSLTLTYSQPTSGTYGLSYSLDGGTTYSGTTTALSGFNPNEIGFQSGNDVLEIDNLVITATPEPTALNLLGLASVLLLIFNLRNSQVGRFLAGRTR